MKNRDFESLFDGLFGFTSIVEMQRQMNKELYTPVLPSSLSATREAFSSSVVFDQSSAMAAFGLSGVSDAIESMLRLQGSGLALSALDASPALTSLGSVDEFVKQLAPKIPESTLSLVQQDIALNAIALTGMTARSNMLSGQWSDLLINQTAAISSSYSDFISEISIADISAVGKVHANRVASQAIQISSVSQRFSDGADDQQEIDEESLVVYPDIFPQIILDTEKLDSEGYEWIDDEPVGTLVTQISFQIVSLGTQIASIRHETNLVSQAIFAEPTFKATIETEFVATGLPLKVVRSPSDFFEFCERLYFYIYESSGSYNRVKLLGVVYPRVMDRIKHFRRQSAHDIDHGDSKKINEDRLVIGTYFEELIGKRYPATPEDWTAAQIKMMEEVSEFLAMTYAAALAKGEPQA